MLGRKSSLLSDDKENSEATTTPTECNNNVSEEKTKIKLKNSRSEKSQADSDTSDDERMVICEEDTNSGENLLEMSLFLLLVIYVFQQS